MTDYESLLTRWQSAGVIDTDTAACIRTWESAQSENSIATRVAETKRDARIVGVQWQGRAALVLGGILLASGVVLFVSAHWDQLGPGMRYLLVMAMVTVFHLGGAVARDRYPATSTVLHAAGTISTGAAIALVGQIFNIQEHWPAAVLMWAVAALAGWILLRDQAQQTLALLLFPSWLICEWSFAAKEGIGAEVYIGRFLFVWAILYLTFFLGTKRRIVRGILFAVSAVAAFVGVFLMLEGWRSWGNIAPYPPFHTRFWGWVGIAAIPVLISFARLRKSMIPVLVSIAFVIALPWCTRMWIERFHYGGQESSWTRTEPNLAAHALVAAFCVLLIWWGVRQASRGLVNLGIVAFGAAVAWFYFSDLFDKMGRSLGLIGLGILFLAGGWVLEKTRRGLLTHIAQSSATLEEAR